MKTRSVSTLLALGGALASIAWAAQPSDTSDPLIEVESGFPRSIQLNENGHLLEFCPDGTCDGFVATRDVPLRALKDFGYLYIYFFSDYTFLDTWRAGGSARGTAEQVLSNPAYHECQRQNDREAARCVLLKLSHNDRIKLIFVRYDEGERHVVPRSLVEQLSGKKSDGDPQ